MTQDATADSHVVDLDGLAHLAQEVARAAKPGSVVWLSGELGSGKTAFVKEAVRVMGAHNPSSPTYTLVNQYTSPHGTIYHVDCYRLDDPDDAIDLDFPELIRTGLVTFVEWPERAGGHAPPPDVHLVFRHVGDPERRRVERKS